MLCLQKCQSRQGKKSKDILLYFFAFVLFFKAIYFGTTLIATKNHWGQIIAQLVQIINELQRPHLVKIVIIASVLNEGFVGYP